MLYVIRALPSTVASDGCCVLHVVEGWVPACRCRAASTAPASMSDELAAALLGRPAKQLVVGLVVGGAGGGGIFCMLHAGSKSSWQIEFWQ